MCSVLVLDAGVGGSVSSCAHVSAAPQSEYTLSDCCSSSAPGGSAQGPSSRLAAAGTDMIIDSVDVVLCASCRFCVL